jgi:hypothetical protein
MTMTLRMTAAALLAATVAGASPASAVQRQPYPEIKVTVAEVIRPDPALQAAMSALAAATAKKDTNALLALVAPGFVWTFDSRIAEEFDMGRTAVHNFKVAFGFRALGKDADGGVEDGPYWSTLSSFAYAGSFYTDSSHVNLVCGPARAWPVDDSALEQARAKLDTAEDTSEWYFIPRHALVMANPNAQGQPMATLSKVAVPVLGFYPKAEKGQPEPQATHIEILLPSGKSGFIPVATAKPMYGSRLCFARTPDGAWKIAAYDQVE